MRSYIKINQEYQYLEKFIQSLPDTFDEQGTVLFEGRNTIKQMQVGTLSVNVKSFHKPNIINQFVYGNFRASKARRSFEYANILIENGIDTPEPIAYVELKSGLRFVKSFYVSVQETFDGLMREFQKGSILGREELLKQFAQFTANMHDKGILHIDYSPGNILYKKIGNKYRFYLVDLNRMRFGKVSMDEGCENFRRLWGNKEMMCYIAVEYANTRGFDPEKCKALVLSYHNKFWENFSKRHKGRKPYIAES